VEYTLTPDELDDCIAYANENYPARKGRYEKRGENPTHIYSAILVGQMTEVAAAHMLNKPMPSFEVCDERARFEEDLCGGGIKGCPLWSVKYVGEPTWVFNYSDIDNDIRAHDPILHPHHFITQITADTFKLENSKPVPPDVIKANLKPLKNGNPYKRALYLSDIPEEFL
jgi:hypothetical protein